MILSLTLPLTASGKRRVRRSSSYKMERWAGVRSLTKYSYVRTTSVTSQATAILARVMHHCVTDEDQVFSHSQHLTSSYSSSSGNKRLAIPGPAGIRVAVAVGQEAHESQ